MSPIQHQQERLDFIVEEKSFGRLLIPLARHRNMTRIAQPEQMAAAEQGKAVNEALVQKTAADTQRVRRRNQSNNH